MLTDKEKKKKIKDEISKIEIMTSKGSDLLKLSLIPKQINLYEKYIKLEDVKKPEQKKIKDKISYLNSAIRTLDAHKDMHKIEGKITIEEKEIDDFINIMIQNCGYNINECIKFFLSSFNIFTHESIKKGIQPSLTNSLFNTIYIDKDNRTSSKKNTLYMEHAANITVLCAYIQLFLKEILRIYKPNLFEIALQGIINSANNIEDNRKDIINKALCFKDQTDLITSSYIIPAEIERLLRNLLKNKDSLKY